MKFKLEIEIENDAMRRSSDVAHALVDVAITLKTVWGIRPRTQMIGTRRLIKDTNGNSVGHWVVEDEAPKPVLRSGVMTPTPSIEEVLKKFPAEFGMRAFPATKFRASRSSSYINDDGVVMVYVEVERHNGWQSFGKGTEAEVLAEVVPCG